MICKVTTLLRPVKSLRLTEGQNSKEGPAASRRELPRFTADREKKEDVAALSCFPLKLEYETPSIPETKGGHMHNCSERRQDSVLQETE